jgi:hypothetical protein
MKKPSTYKKKVGKAVSRGNMYKAGKMLAKRNKAKSKQMRKK